jgi:hypothetical protein
VPAPVAPAPAAPASRPAEAPKAALVNAAPQGLAVVALPGAADAAWPLAQGVYGDAALRAPAIDDAHARVLCGDAAPAGSAPDLRDLADTVAALRGADAPSRALLATIAQRFAVRGIVVVAIAPATGGAPSPASATARVYLSDAGEFDAATYSPDGSTAPAGPPAWGSAIRSLERAFPLPPAPPSPAPPPPTPAPALAVHAAPAPHAEQADKSRHGRPFYESPWFWGAVGVAAAAGTATYLLSRDNGTSTIHLHLQVPSQ